MLLKKRGIELVSAVTINMIGSARREGEGVLGRMEEGRTKLNGETEGLRGVRGRLG